MSASDRYFPNPYEDYDYGKNLNYDQIVNRQYLVNFIRDTAFLCINNCKAKSSPKYCEGSVYTGNLGLVFMCYKCITSDGVNEQDKQHMLNYLNNCVKANEEYYATNETRQSKDVSYLCGKGGFYAMAALACRLLKSEQKCIEYAQKFASLAKICEPIDFLSKGSDELFVGRAGFLAGVLMFKKYLNIEVLPQSEMFKLCDVIVKSGRNYSIRTSCPCPLMYAYHGSEYLGSAHGLAGILQILLSFPDYLRQNPESEKHVRNSVDFLLSIKKPSGNFPSSMNMENPSLPRQENKDLIHWCHGAGGVIYTLARAYIVWRDDKYLNACKRCSDLIWSKGLLRKGPGICHGIGGSGLCHLLVYRLTNDARYLYRASRFAEFLNTNDFRAGARTPDNPFSLFEGLAGTVCLFVDLLHPEQSEYPLIPVF